MGSSAAGGGGLIWISHPTGNTFVRALLACAADNHLLGLFFTTIGRGGEGGRRREYPIDPQRLSLHPTREALRLTLGKALRKSGFPQAEARMVDWVYKGLDSAVARKLGNVAKKDRPDWVYCYEDGALETFLRARDLGVKCAYELPIAYWETSRRLLQEESARRPDWAFTLGAPDDPHKKLKQKTVELGLADLVICPSQFVKSTIPFSHSAVHVVPFGTPSGIGRFEAKRDERMNSALRLLFVGSLGQRKGLADLLEAMKLVSSPHITLTLLGPMLAPAPFYHSFGVPFHYESPRPHREVLEVMRKHDVLVLPSIVEGRALVQQEAMSVGLPVIATANAGAEDLIKDGETGFLVPIRDPEALAEKISWCVQHKRQCAEMGSIAAERSASLTWSNYGQTILRLLDQA